MDTGKALQERLDAMQMTARETDELLSYLIGGAPDVFERGLDYVQRIRDHGPSARYAVPQFPHSWSECGHRADFSAAEHDANCPAVPDEQQRRAIGQ